MTFESENRNAVDACLSSMTTEVFLSQILRYKVVLLLFRPKRYNVPGRYPRYIVVFPCVLRCLRQLCAPTPSPSLSFAPCIASSDTRYVYLRPAWESLEGLLIARVINDTEKFPRIGIISRCKK